MAEDAPELNVVAIASAVCGSVIVIVTIVIAVCVIGYCYEKLRSRAADRARSSPETPSHHQRRPRRRRRQEDERGGGGGADLLHEDVILEDSELQPHPPPPSYSRVHQYSSISDGLNHTAGDAEENNEGGGSSPVSMFIGDGEMGDDETAVHEDSTTNTDTIAQDDLPLEQNRNPILPTYSAAQLEALATRNTAVEQDHHGPRDSIPDLDSESPSQHTSTGTLPPSYSTARMELMRLRIMMV